MPPICAVCDRSMRGVCVFPVTGRSVYRCPSCAHRTLWPFPGKGERSELYGRPEYFTDDLASLHGDLGAGYDPRSPIVRLYRRHIAEIARYAPPKARLFEVGCARGAFLDIAAKAGYEASGIDMNPHGVAYAAANFRVDATCGEFVADEVGAGYGVVASYDTIEHVPDPGAFMDKVAGILSPGGLAAIGTPDAGSPLLSFAEAAARMSGGRWRYPLWRVYGNGAEHLHLFTRRGLARLARRSGLEPLATYGYSIPVRNMRDLFGPYRAALHLASAMPYEFVLLARKK